MSNIPSVDQSIATLLDTKLEGYRDALNHQHERVKRLEKMLQGNALAFTPRDPKLDTHGMYQRALPWGISRDVLLEGINRMVSLTATHRGIEVKDCTGVTDQEWGVKKALPDVIKSMRPVEYCKNIEEYVRPLGVVSGGRILVFYKSNEGTLTNKLSLPIDATYEQVFAAVNASRYLAFSGFWA